MMPIMIMWEVKNAQRFSFRSCNGTCEKLGLKVENIQKNQNKVDLCCLYLWMVLWRIHFTSHVSLHGPSGWGHKSFRRVKYYFLETSINAQVKLMLFHLFSAHVQPFFPSIVYSYK